MKVVKVGQRWKFENGSYSITGVIKKITLETVEDIEFDLEIESFSGNLPAVSLTGDIRPCIMNRDTTSWVFINEGYEKMMTHCVCFKCGLNNEWAEPNQKDGSYICYNCRN